MTEAQSTALSRLTRASRGPRSGPAGGPDRQRLHAMMPPRLCLLSSFQKPCESAAFRAGALGWSRGETALRQESIVGRSVGTVVECEVVRAEPWGVFVRLLDDGASGFVRRQDWSWSRRVVDLRAHVQPGEKVRCQVIGQQRNQLQLSRQAANPDPFPLFKRRHAVGDTVVGQVQLLAQRGAGVLVALEDGVDGFIPRSELPAVARQEDGFGVLNDDLVAAQILRFDGDRVVLSVQELLRKEDQEYERSQAGRRATFRQHPSLGLQLEGLYWDLQLKETPEPEVAPAVRQRIRRILVVEDKESVGESLEQVFEYLGFDCDLAQNVEQGRRFLDRHHYDLLIVDMNLSTQSGGELLRSLANDTLLCVIVLTASSAVEWFEALKRRPGPHGRVFQKPTGVDQILRWLETCLGQPADAVAPFEASWGHGSPAAAEAKVPGDAERLFFDDQDAVDEEGENSSLWSGPNLTSGHLLQIERLLERLVQTTKADLACVLSYRPGPLFEKVAGQFPDLDRRVQQDLEVSPIGNVIREGRYLAVTDVQQRPAEFRHLVSVTEVGSFVGMPIEYADQASYGLFLIGRQPGQLKSISEDQLEQTATGIGIQLAHRRFNTVIAQNQGLLLTGFLADSLLHEIRNELQSLDDFSAIQLMLAKRLGEMKEKEIASFNKATVEVREVSRRLNELVELFRNLAGQNPAQEIDLNEVIRRLRATLIPFAEEYDVQLDLDLAEDLPALFVNPKLIDQPILNLMINGIEQMASYGDHRRRLRVSTHFDGIGRGVDGEGEAVALDKSVAFGGGTAAVGGGGDGAAAFPLRVNVADTGKGVHFGHRERIFDPFFTTKRHGTGLGLYISRVFVERFGGCLELTRALMFRGSQLTIRIPRQVLVS